MINLNELKIEYRPFPHGTFSNVFDENVYKKIVREFPSPPILGTRDHFGGKLYISEQPNVKAEFFDILSKSTVYTQLYEYIKSKIFLQQLLDKLNEENIDVQNTSQQILSLSRFSNLYFFKKNLLKLKLKLINTSYVTARFEFSFISLDGVACLRPHTDSPQKILSLVVPILSDYEKEHYKELGLGTSIYDVKNDRNYFNQKNKFLDRNDVREISRMPFKSNTMTLLVKTFNSLHGIEPNLFNFKSHYRRSLTINLEVINRNQGSNLL